MPTAAIECGVCIDDVRGGIFERVKPVLVVWFVFLGTGACTEPEAPAVNGYLYFGAGYYLGRLNLSTGASEAVANLGDSDIEYLSALDGHELLLSISTYRAQRRRSRVLRFDPLSNHRSAFVLGSEARYLPKTNTIVYDDGFRLVAVSRRDVRGDSTVIAVHGRDYPAYVVELDSGEILLEGTESDLRSIRRYDPLTGVSESLSPLTEQCTLEAALWIADRGRLLCRKPVDAESRPYRFVSLEGRADGDLALPAEKAFRAVVYLADQGALILTETWRGLFDSSDRTAVWVYDLSTGASRRIADNQYLGDSVVYRRSIR